MQTIPRTHCVHNTLGIAYKVKRQYTTTILGKLRTEYYYLVFCKLQEQNRSCLFPCSFSMQQPWCFMQIVRIKVCHHRHEEPKGKCLVLCSWRRERGYVSGTPKLLAPPWGWRIFAPDGRRKWVYQLQLLPLYAKKWTFLSDEVRCYDWPSSRRHRQCQSVVVTVQPSLPQSVTPNAPNPLQNRANPILVPFTAILSD